MFLGAFPDSLLIDLLTRFQNFNSNETNNESPAIRESIGDRKYNSSFGFKESFEIQDEREAKFLYDQIIQEILGYQCKQETNGFQPDLNKSFEYEESKIDDEDSFPPNNFTKKAHKCKLERSITLIGYLFDLYYRKPEYSKCFKYINNTLLNPSESYSQNDLKYVNSKSNFLCQYILSLIEYYIEDVKHSRNKEKYQKFKPLPVLA